MRMPRNLPGFLLLCLLLWGGGVSVAGGTTPPAPTKESPHIAGLSVERVDGQFVASFRLASVFDPDVLGKIESGLETVFEYRLEVLHRRRFWIDERTVQHRILASTRYDSLSRQYSLLLKVDGEVERSSTTDKPEEMRRWITDIRGVPLGPVSGFIPPGEYIVRVKADLQPRFVLLFIPWSRDTSWVRAPLPGDIVDVNGPGK
jgi:Domain of unknown function (DUF4390)